MTMLRVQEAAKNNAEWCQTVCHAHGIPGIQQEHLWYNSNPSPLFYPNVVTTTGKAGIESQMEVINQLLQSHLPGGWTVKDSFHCLDLRSMGFRILFEATWLFRPVQPIPPRVESIPISISTIQTKPALQKWESAWKGNSSDRLNQPLNTFKPELLANPNVTILGGIYDLQVICGVIANRSSNIVSVSNLFASTRDPLSFQRIACLQAVCKQFSKSAVVGYEQKHALPAYLSMGFEEIFPLRIWIKS